MRALVMTRCYSLVGIFVLVGNAIRVDDGDEEQPPTLPHLLSCQQRKQEGQRVFTADLSKVHLVGRWYDVPGGKSHGWRAEFVLRFKGSSVVGVNMRSPLGMYFVCKVDGQEPFRREHKEGNFMIADRLDAGKEHVVRCGRSNEAFYGSTVLEGIILDNGAEVLPPQSPPNQMRIEFIGDSITAGFATKWQKGQPPPVPSMENCDVYDSYARFFADAWSTSEWSAVARSGIGILPADSEKTPMLQEWLCGDYFAHGQACAHPWAFQWQPNLVIVNLGTNDFFWGFHSDTELKDAYKALFLSIHQKYNNALIVSLIPLVYSCHSKEEPKWARMKDTIEAAVREVAIDKVKVFATGSPSAPWLDCAPGTDYSDKLHPTVAGNEKFAKKLFEELNPVVCQTFPDKC